MRAIGDLYNGGRKPKGKIKNVRKILKEETITS